MAHWGPQPGFDAFTDMPVERRLAHFLTSEQRIGQWTYSSPGYALIGHVIERATTARYADVIRGLLPVPLPDSSIGEPPADAAHGHRDGKPFTWSPGIFIGTNDVWSTESDIETRTHALRSGPLGPRLTGPYAISRPPREPRFLRWAAWSALTGLIPRLRWTQVFPYAHGDRARRGRQHPAGVPEPAMPDLRTRNRRRYPHPTLPLLTRLARALDASLDIAIDKERISTEFRPHAA